MNLIKKIIFLFKKIFNKNDKIVMIEASVENLNNDDRNNFVNSLKVDLIPKYQKKKVETPICFGNGLGIQTKISC